MKEVKLSEITKAIARFDGAVRQHSWRGGAHPASIPCIEKEYSQAFHHLTELCERLWKEKK